MKPKSSRQRFLMLLAAGGLFTSASLFGSVPAVASSDPGVKAGILECSIASGWGMVLASSRSAECVYTPAKGASERYTGSVSKFGVDIGYLSSATILWAVFAPSADVAPGALDGTYFGATVGATAVYGAGANVLIGGGSNSIALQPVSVEGNSGFNLAAGVGTISLSSKAGPN